MCEEVDRRGCRLMNRIEMWRCVQKFDSRVTFMTNMQTDFKRIDGSKDDFSKMLFFTSTKDGQLLESNIFEKNGSQRLLSVSLWTAQVLMVVASTHNFEERGVTTVVHCSSGHDHVTYLRVFFFPSVSQ